MNEVEVSVINKKKKRFHCGFCFKTIFFLFVIGCFLGTCYEEILTFSKKGIWESRQGLIYGPLNPVYGVGVAIFVICLGKNDKNRSWIKTYLYSSLLGGATEYVLNWAQEIIFHSHSWDYTGYFLNIGGRTTVPFMLFWGFLGLVILKILYPLVLNLLNRLPNWFGQTLYMSLLTFIIFDISISILATTRQVERRKGKKPITVIGEICDKIYTDEYLKRIYPNAKIKEKVL